jgi:nucleoid-associated protein EbfC
VEPGGQLDMQQLLAAAAAMQSQLMNAQQELAEAEIEGTAGGGLVRATVNGQGELVDLSINPAAIDTADPQESAQTISDLVLAAYRDACRAVDDLQQETMAPFAAGFGSAGQGGAGEGGLPGLGGLPDLTGLPGFPGAGASGGTQRSGPVPPGAVPPDAEPPGRSGPADEPEPPAEDPPASER